MTTPLDYRETMAEDQRLLILQTLQGEPDQTADSGKLRQRLTALRHQVSHDQLRAHLEWLDEARLITLLGVNVRIARLTVRGEDVATGQARHPGVARPG